MVKDTRRGDRHHNPSTDRHRNPGSDRHREPNKNRHRLPRSYFQPDPPSLLTELDAAVGRMNRSKVITELIRRYLAGEPMPPPPAR